MGETFHIAELDDDPDKVYLFGMDLHDEQEAEEMQEVLDSLFHQSGVMLVNLPMEAADGIEVTEADQDDLRELLDYRDVMEGIDDG